MNIWEDSNNYCDQLVEVKSIKNNCILYPEWTKVTRFLAAGLWGVRVREIQDEKDINRSS